MGKTRVHLLAKELGIETKDLIAQLDKLGMRGRKAQSAMEDDEVTRVRAALAAQEKPQVHVGEEKVIARVVKTEEEGQGSIEARETVVERRVRTNVFADTGANTVSPPQSSAAKPCSANPFFTFSKWASMRKRQLCSRDLRSSPSWVTSTMARHHCSTPFAALM